MTDLVKRLRETDPVDYPTVCSEDMNKAADEIESLLDINERICDDNSSIRAQASATQEKLEAEIAALKNELATAKNFPPMYDLIADKDAEIAELKKDAERLDFLDENLKFKMGWVVSSAPAGNLSVQSVIFLGEPPTPIRSAIDAALTREQIP